MLVEPTLGRVRRLGGDIEVKTLNKEGGCAREGGRHRAIAWGRIHPCAERWARGPRTCG